MISHKVFLIEIFEGKIVLYATMQHFFPKFILAG